MTQQQMVIEYIKLNGEILPAKISGSIFMGTMFGSETSKRCRELRKKGILGSRGEGRFEVFYLKETLEVKSTPKGDWWLRPEYQRKQEVVSQKLF